VVIFFLNQIFSGSSSFAEDGLKSAVFCSRHGILQLITFAEGRGFMEQWLHFDLRGRMGD